MQFTDEHIAEFQMLYKKHFGKEISKEVALDKAIRLVRLMKVVLEGEPKIKTNEANQPSITNQ